jgi:hypothetical protein
MAAVGEKPMAIDNNAAARQRTATESYNNED